MYYAELNVPKNHVYLFKPQLFFIFSLSPLYGKGLNVIYFFSA